IAISLGTIAMAKGEQEASSAAEIIPIMMSLLGLQLTLYCLLIHRGLVLSIAVSLLCWSALAILPLIFGPPNFFFSVSIFAVSFLLFSTLVDRLLKTQSFKGTRIKLTPLALGVRCLCGGL